MKKKVIRKYSKNRRNKSKLFCDININLNKIIKLIITKKRLKKQ